MSISILGGAAKGFTLAAPSSKDTRPTSVLLKRKFFDSHQRMDNTVFFDVCAGSGSVGLEALSRGADLVEFVEANSQAIRIIGDNKEKMFAKFELAGEVKITKKDCLKWLDSFPVNEGDERSKILFFDPPYENKELYQSFLGSLKEKSGICSKLVLEFCRQKTAPESEVQKWFGKPDKSYRQGTSFLYIYELD